MGNIEIKIPDLGGAKDAEVIEILVKVGDLVKVEQPLVTLEGDKASMEVPSSAAGKVASINIKIGDKVNQGDAIMTLESADAAAAPKVEAAKLEEAPKVAETPKVVEKAPSHSSESGDPSSSFDEPHAGPSVRRVAHELDIDLSKVKGSGEKGRITKEDLKKYLGASTVAAPVSGGFNFPPLPQIDFSQFGEIEKQPLSKIKKISGANLARNWATIPHVTQFAKADITEMEAFRKSQAEVAKKQGIKLTPLVFLMKAVVVCLKAHPEFNASLEGDNLILKKYFHIGVAVDTPKGLVVPVIRDVDKKSLNELAKELAEISEKARTKGLSMSDMQGGCFSISSLGGIGGTAFTPIINAPEVAILGVSRSEVEPVFQKETNEFDARLMLPLSLSYDHRVIDGAAGARFIVQLCDCLADIRQLLL